MICASIMSIVSDLTLSLLVCEITRNDRMFIHLCVISENPPRPLITPFIRNPRRGSLVRGVGLGGGFLWRRGDQIDV